MRTGAARARGAHTLAARAAGALAALVMLASVVPTARAQDTVGVQLDWGRFVGTGATSPLANDGPRCAATAMVNSFVYLIITNGGSGGKLLKGGSTDHNGDGKVDLTDTRDQLANDVHCGGTAQSIWEGKKSWLVTYACDLFSYSGMVAEDPALWLGGSSLTKGDPTFEFLMQKLHDGEDVEIGFSLAGGGHAVTLTSLHFIETDGNRQWNPDKGEKALIDYIDPN